MTTNKKDNKSEKKSRVKIGKLTNNEETVKDLTDKEAEQIKGGFGTLANYTFGSLANHTNDVIKALGGALSTSAQKG